MGFWRIKECLNIVLLFPLSLILTDSLLFFHFHFFSLFPYFFFLLLFSCSVTPVGYKNLCCPFFWQFPGGVSCCRSLYFLHTSPHPPSSISSVASHLQWRLVHIVLLRGHVARSASGILGRTGFPSPSSPASYRKTSLVILLIGLQHLSHTIQTIYFG